MALLVRLQELLDRSGVAYTHTVHPLAYTAREVAAAEHLPAQEVAKVVVFHKHRSQKSKRVKKKSSHRAELLALQWS
jgi:hypothetical protein